jgi:hypothetical protein
MLAAVRSIVLTPAEVRVSAFGSDLAGLKAAVAAADSRNARLVIDIPVTAAITDENGPVRLPDGLRIDFVGNGSVTWDKFGLPLFWAKNVSGLRVNNAVIYFAGTAATSLPAVTATFYNDVLDRNANGFPTRDVMAAFGLFGCRDVQFVSPRFLATDYSGPDRLMQRAVTISSHEDGSPSTGIYFLGTTQLDGVTMGLLAWGVDGLSIGNMVSKRWGQLAVATYTWEVACHPIYISAQAANANVSAGTLVDEGTEVAGNTSNGDSHSFKFIAVTGGRVDSISSHRGCGALEWRTKGTVAAPFTFGPVEWWGTTASALGTPPVNMPGAGTSGLAEYTEFSTIVLHAPADLTGSLMTNVSGGGQAADTVRHIDFGTITFEYAGANHSQSIPLIVGCMSDCQFNVTVLAPNWTIANALVVRFDSGGSGNTMDITTQGPTFASVRFVEQDAASSGNFATFREFGTANVRTVGPTV